MAATTTTFVIDERSAPQEEKSSSSNLAQGSSSLSVEAPTTNGEYFQPSIISVSGAHFTPLQWSPGRGPSHVQNKRLALENSYRPPPPKKAYKPRGGPKPPKPPKPPKFISKGPEDYEFLFCDSDEDSSMHSGSRATSRSASAGAWRAEAASSTSRKRNRKRAVALPKDVDMNTRTAVRPEDFAKGMSGRELRARDWKSLGQRNYISDSDLPLDDMELPLDDTELPLADLNPPLDEEIKMRDYDPDSLSLARTVESVLAEDAGRDEGARASRDWVDGGELDGEDEEDFYFCSDEEGNPCLRLGKEEHAHSEEARHAHLRSAHFEEEEPHAEEAAMDLDEEEEAETHALLLTPEEPESSTPSSHTSLVPLDLDAAVHLDESGHRDTPQPHERPALSEELALTHELIATTHALVESAQPVARKRGRPPRPKALIDPVTGRKKIGRSPRYPLPSLGSLTVAAPAVASRVDAHCPVKPSRMPQQSSSSPLPYSGPFSSQLSDGISLAFAGTTTLSSNSQDNMNVDPVMTSSARRRARRKTIHAKIAVKKERAVLEYLTSVGISVVLAGGASQSLQVGRHESATEEEETQPGDYASVQGSILYQPSTSHPELVEPLHSDEPIVDSVSHRSPSSPPVEHEDTLETQSVSDNAVGEVEVPIMLSVPMDRESSILQFDMAYDLDRSSCSSQLKSPRPLPPTNAANPRQLRIPSQLMLNHHVSAQSSVSKISMDVDPRDSGASHGIPERPLPPSPTTNAPPFPVDLRTTLGEEPTTDAAHRKNVNHASALVANATASSSQAPSSQASTSSQVRSPPHTLPLRLATEMPHELPSSGARPSIINTPATGANIDQLSSKLFISEAYSHPLHVLRPSHYGGSLGKYVESFNDYYDFKHLRRDVGEDYLQEKADRDARFWMRLEQAQKEGTRLRPRAKAVVKALSSRSVDLLPEQEVRLFYSIPRDPDVWDQVIRGVERAYAAERIKQQVVETFHPVGKELAEVCLRREGAGKSPSTSAAFGQKPSEVSMDIPADDLGDPAPSDLPIEEPTPQTQQDSAERTSLRSPILAESTSSEPKVKPRKIKLSLRLPPITHSDPGQQPERPEHNHSLSRLLGSYHQLITNVKHGYITFADWEDVDHRIRREAASWDRIERGRKAGLLNDYNSTLFRILRDRQHILPAEEVIHVLAHLEASSTRSNFISPEHKDDPWSCIVKQMVSLGDLRVQLRKLEESPPLSIDVFPSLSGRLAARKFLSDENVIEIASVELGKAVSGKLRCVVPLPGLQMVQNPVAQSLHEDVQEIGPAEPESSTLPREIEGDIPPAQDVPAPTLTSSKKRALDSLYGPEPSLSPVEPPRRGRGRPHKNPPPNIVAQSSEVEDLDTMQEPEPPMESPPLPRPTQIVIPPAQDVSAPIVASSTRRARDGPELSLSPVVHPRRGRGRPRKSQSAQRLSGVVDEADVVLGPVNPPPEPLAPHIIDSLKSLYQHSGHVCPPDSLVETWSRILQADSGEVKAWVREKEEAQRVREKERQGAECAPALMLHVSKALSTPASSGRTCGSLTSGEFEKLFEPFGDAMRAFLERVG